DHQIADQRKRRSAQRLEPHARAVLERVQPQLAGGRARLAAVWAAVHEHAARTADALAAIAVERDRPLAARAQPIVEHIERLEQRHLGSQAVLAVLDEAAGGGVIRLAPDLEG